ncbi:hypothetical protein CTEN210_12491 [Chaetoceros tenuissimus]|uniref:Repressor of RNA polymerase III transcription n=1 Tax=Chaetoceros tenuissimus TaxID=426638 RepID=A0AAD3HA45_9STRA|nr:hypothetical protein CTEN210_12491 [Chaetoceros tenuissimus]
MKFLEDDRLAQLTAQLTEATICERVINGRIEAFTMKRAGTDKKYAHALGEKYQNEIMAEETDFKRMQRTRSTSIGSDTEISMQHLRKISSPPSPKAKKVRIQSKFQPPKPQGRQRSNSASLSDGSSPKLPSAMRSMSDSFRARSGSLSETMDANIVTNFPYSNSPLGDFHDSSTQRLMTDLILTLNASFPDYDFSSTRPAHFSHIPSAQVAMNRVNERLSELAACTPQGDMFLPQLWNAIDESINLKECEVYSYVPPNRDDDDDPLSFLADSLDGTDSAMPLWTLNFFFVNKSLKRIVLFTCVQTMRTEVVNADEGQGDDDFVLKDPVMEDFGSPGRIVRSGISRFDGSVDEEDEGGLDYDMEDGMNQAVEPPSINGM